jgi:N-acetyl sugar amidotransferase
VNEIRYCQRCFMPSTRPRMAIDSEGICGGCRVADDRLGQIDYGPRVAQLSKLLGSRPSDRPYDCIVAWSGGKDSSAIALQLKYDFGLNPLLVTFSPLLPTPEGDANRTRLLDLGFDSVMVRPNQNISRILARRFFVERGDPKVHWNAGINAAPMRMAVALKIPLVFYAEHGESEYGGRLLSQKHLMERDLEEVLEHQVGDDPLNWATGQVGVRDLYPYLYPDGDDIEEVGLRALYFAFFTPWDVTENYKYVSEYFPFQGNARGRTYGTFTDYDSVDDYMDDLYYYMQFVKFGFGRCLRDCARMIQRGRMTREEAFGFISRYDGEFPEESIGICLDYIRMERAEFDDVVDRHRSPRVWERDGSSWKLRFPPRIDK